MTDQTTQLALELGNQRWRERRDSYRPPQEVIRTAEYEVAPIADDTTAKAFVTKHHYSATYPAARFRFGLHRRGELVGVAVFSHPCNDAVLTRVFPGSARESVELGRFVLLDSVPGNGETWFLARCFDQLRAHVHGVVSFSDPMPREKADGARIFPGHVGTIYQASNGRYIGRGASGKVRLLPDGRVLSARAITKIRARDKGWVHSSKLLEAYGADPLEGDAAEWLAHWLPRLTRSMRHPGNHKYAWALNRRAGKALQTGLPYPKMSKAA